MATCLLCNHVAEAGEAEVLRGRRSRSEVPRSPRRLGEPCRRAKIGESLATCQRPSGRPDLQSGCVATSRPHAGCSALVAVLVPCHASLEAWVSQMGRFAGARSTYCTLTRRIACLKKILMRCDRDCSATTGRASSEHWILPWSRSGTLALALGSMCEPGQRRERHRHRYRHRAPRNRSHRGT